ncbi:hypothetical protein RRF57_009347 [Xylaria bambusicola]|uniref:Cytochrome P450 n=1 Tax=Xylaria bambusicola TaxID=326684 RepID=A0AAN7UUU0_9PEZI
MDREGVLEMEGGSHLLTTDHNLHRRRRKPLEPFFSRMGVTRLQGMMADVALHLESRLRGFEGQGKVICLDHALSAFSRDIIGRICLGEMTNFSTTPILRQNALPSFVQILSYVPESVLMWVYPQGRVFSVFSNKALSHIRMAMSRPPDKPESSISVFHHIVDSDMPPSERSEKRLAKEAQVLLGGGTASTARTIGFASYYILSQPKIRPKLEEELRDVELERLPFLQAIIKESLRLAIGLMICLNSLSYGVMHRLPRVSPDVPIKYKEYEIPVSVRVAPLCTITSLIKLVSRYQWECLHIMHSDPITYPSPDKFLPERWIGDIDPAMHRSYVPFCRGSRNCLGMNLAMAEMSLALVVLFRPNGPKMELFEIDESDVKQAHDFLIPLPKLDTKGVRILVR